MVCFQRDDIRMIKESLSYGLGVNWFFGADKTVFLNVQKIIQKYLLLFFALFNFD